MNNCTFTGKVYNLEQHGTGEKGRVTFRLAVRKKYVSDADKAANKVNVFVPCVAFGSLAELIYKYSANGKSLTVRGMYDTWEGNDQNGNPTKSHNFKIEDVTFGDKGEDTGSDNGGRTQQSSGTTRRQNPAPAPAPAQEISYDAGEGSLPF